MTSIRWRDSPQSTITYDYEHDQVVSERVERLGADGRLLARPSSDQSAAVVRVSLFEKLIVSGMVKFSNLVPGAGIWMNTQRPEWNDANNALVGNAASVITACYLRRYFAYLKSWLQSKDNSFNVSKEVVNYFNAINSLIEEGVETGVHDATRRGAFVTAMQAAAANTVIKFTATDSQAKRRRSMRVNLLPLQRSVSRFSMKRLTPTVGKIRSFTRIT